MPPIRIPLVYLPAFFIFFSRRFALRSLAGAFFAALPPLSLLAMSYSRSVTEDSGQTHIVARFSTKGALISVTSDRDSCPAIELQSTSTPSPAATEMGSHIREPSDRERFLLGDSVYVRAAASKTSSQEEDHMPSEELLQKYAKGVTQVGLAIEPGDRLLIDATIDAPDFTRRVVAEAYAAGAVNVDVLWDHPTINRARFEHGSKAAAEVVADSSKLGFHI